MERVLSVLCDQEVTIAGTSRTDAGVHAFGQRATFSGDFGIPTDRIAKAANDLLSGKGPFAIGDIRVLEAVEVEETFHARFNAKGKTYWYRIRNAEEPDVMARNYCYQVQKPLDLVAMREAAAYLVGEHDFKGYMAAGGNVPESTVRTIYRAEILEDKSNPGWGNWPCKSNPAWGNWPWGLNWLRLEVTGNGFLYNMVRIITGTLVDVGLGKLDPTVTRRVLETGERRLAGHTAPPQGLYLAQVYFDQVPTQQ